MAIGDRIRKIRKSLDLTQREFGERINLKSNSVALIEGGRNTSDQTISAICREFNANEEWLRTGEGEMLVQPSISDLEVLASRYPNMTRETYALVERLTNLPKASRDIVMEFMRGVIEDLSGNAPSSFSARHPQEMSREEMHAALDRQLDEEKGAAENVSGFGHGKSGTATG